MAHNPKRYPDQPPLDELIMLRQQLYPDMKKGEFARRLGVTRLHVTAIEMGRRRPSLGLTLRWLELLAPKARLEMFGDLPMVRERLRLIKHLQKVAPQTFKAA